MESNNFNQNGQGYQQQYQQPNGQYQQPNGQYQQPNGQYQQPDNGQGYYGQGYQQQYQPQGYRQMNLNGEMIQPEKKKKSKGPIIGGIIVVVVIAIAVIGILVWKSFNGEATNEPLDVAKAYIESFKDRDVDAFMELLPPNTTNADELEEAAQESFDLNDAYEFVYIEETEEYEVQEEYDDDELEEFVDTYATGLGKKTVVAACDVIYSADYEMTVYGTLYTGHQEVTITTVRVGDTWYYITSESEESYDPIAVTEEDTTEEETTETETTEEVTTEEATEEETEADGDTTESTATANEYDWSKMEFVYEGTTYSLIDMTYNDVLAMGFAVDDDYLSEELDDNEYSYSVFAYNSDDADIYVRFKNFDGGGTKTLPDCGILSLEFSRDSWSNFYEASLPNGITFEMSYEDVVTIMGGNPSYEYASEDSDYKSCTFEESDSAYSNEIEFTFDETGLYEIRITSWGIE